VSQSLEIVAGDFAQALLLPHLQKTQLLFLKALRTLDPLADCQIVPAADLGIPYDVLRLGGGFATGCFVEWECRTPVIPVDTTMNIDTSSIFWLDGSPGNAFTREAVEDLQRRIDADSSYEWNFHRGNHFILSCRRSTDGRHALVLHSNEKEFKDQFNGLCPTPGNWYEKAIRVFGEERRIRLLVGDRAVLFTQMAQMLQEFNIVRHRFIAAMLVGDRVRITDEYHKHHYFMPTSTSAALGCYLCEPDEEVPVFSTVGQPITIFRPANGGLNKVHLLAGGTRLVVPHGWGMTASRTLRLMQSEDHLDLNGQNYSLKPGVSLLDHDDVVPRVFDGGMEEFFHLIRPHTPGEPVADLIQVASYSRHGFLQHDRESGPPRRQA
jgi:hypothetical protein